MNNPFLDTSVIAAFCTLMGVLGAAAINGLKDRGAARTAAKVEIAKIKVEEQKATIASVEAAQKALVSTVESLQAQIAAVEKRLDEALQERDELADRLDVEEDYSSLLVDHINNRLPPPPPPRPARRPRIGDAQ